MIEVLRDACAFCDETDNQAEMLKLLSKPQYLNCTPGTLAHALSGAFPMGYGRTSEGAFVRFSGKETNRPDIERAGHVFDDLCRYVANDKLADASKSMLSETYREDIYDQATSPVAF